MSDKPRYVAGFRFYQDRVVLIQKLKPAWQDGLLNGVGGKVEPGESGLEAMRREYLEETGEEIRDWECFATLGFPECYVDFFRSFAGNDEFSTARTMEAETVRHVRVSKIQYHLTVPNLKWLIPLALTKNERTVCYAG